MICYCYFNLLMK